MAGDNASEMPHKFKIGDIINYRPNTRVRQVPSVRLSNPNVMVPIQTKHNKWFLLQEVNAWIREQTGDPNDGLTNGQAMPLRDVKAICRAIECCRINLAAKSDPS